MGEPGKQTGKYTAARDQAGEQTNERAERAKQTNKCEGEWIGGQQAGKCAGEPAKHADEFTGAGERAKLTNECTGERATHTNECAGASERANKCGSDPAGECCTCDLGDWTEIDLHIPSNAPKIGKVLYHGTTPEALVGILKDGLLPFNPFDPTSKVKNRNNCVGANGPTIYTTPCLNIASIYATPTIFQNRIFQVIVRLRSVTLPYAIQNNTLPHIWDSVKFGFICPQMQDKNVEWLYHANGGLFVDSILIRVVEIKSPVIKMCNWRENMIDMHKVRAVTLHLWVKNGGNYEEIIDYIDSIKIRPNFTKKECIQSIPNVAEMDPEVRQLMEEICQFLPSEMEWEAITPISGDPA